MVSGADANSSIRRLSGTIPYEHPQGRGTGDAHGLAELYPNFYLFTAMVGVSACRRGYHADARNHRGSADASVHLVGRGVGYGMEAEGGYCVVSARASDGRLASNGERASLYADSIGVYVGSLNGVGEIQCVGALIDLEVIRLPSIASYLEGKLWHALYEDMLDDVRAERHADHYLLADGIGIVLMGCVQEPHSGHDGAGACDSHPELHAVRIPVIEVVAANSAGRNPNTVLHRKGVLLQGGLLRGISGYDACSAVHDQAAGQPWGDAPSERRVSAWGRERDGILRPQRRVRHRQGVCAEVRPQSCLRSVDLCVGLVGEDESCQVDLSVFTIGVTEGAAVEF